MLQPKEKTTTVTAVHADVNGDVALESNSLNKPATAGPASDSDLLY